MSDNHESEMGKESSSEPELDDLFLSPDDSGAEEIPFNAAKASEDSATPAQPAAAAAAPVSQASAPAPGIAPSPAPASAPAAAGPSSEALQAVEAERDDFRNRMMRVAADLENFRKRTVREKDDLRKYGIDRVVLELLPVLDNLERALEHADKSADSTTIVDGVRMVQRQFVTALEKHGVAGFDAKGEHFDPQKHEAIQQIETTEHQTGLVLEEYQKGYYLHERLIRPALVVVARNPSGEVSTPTPATEAPASEDDEDSATPEQPEVAVSDSEPSDGNDESAVN